MNAVLLAWLVEVGLIAYRDVKKGRTAAGLPVPGDFLATFVVFGTLSAIGQSQSGGTFAAVTAWGFVVATFLNVMDPTLANGIANAITGTAKGGGGQSPAGSTGPAGGAVAGTTRYTKS